MVHPWVWERDTLGYTRGYERRAGHTTRGYGRHAGHTTRVPWWVGWWVSFLVYTTRVPWWPYYPRVYSLPLCSLGTPCIIPVPTSPTQVLTGTRSAERRGPGLKGEDSPG